MTQTSRVLRLLGLLQSRPTWTGPELADRLSFSGTPEEITAKIRTELVGTGVNHFIAAITDASLVKAFTGQDVEGVATVEEQLRLLAEEVVPNFA